MYPIMRVKKYSFRGKRFQSSCYEVFSEPPLFTNIIRMKNRLLPKSFDSMARQMLVFSLLILPTAMVSSLTNWAFYNVFCYAKKLYLAFSDPKAFMYIRLSGPFLNND